MIVPIYAPYFASGENHTVEYAEIKRPFDAFMTVWVKRIDGTICKALDLQADIALFLQINSRGRLCLCADASKVKLIELKTIEPAVVVTVDNMRVEPMSFIKITQDNNRSLNPTKL